MLDTAAQYVMAHAYISRHGLFFKVRSRFCLVGPDLSRPNPTNIVGHGLTLYQAVLDYQEKSGVGWGS